MVRGLGFGICFWGTVQQNSEYTNGACHSMGLFGTVVPCNGSGRYGLTSGFTFFGCLLPRLVFVRSTPTGFFYSSLTPGPSSSSNFIATKGL